MWAVRIKHEVFCATERFPFVAVVNNPRSLHNVYLSTIKQQENKHVRSILSMSVFWSTEI